MSDGPENTNEIIHYHHCSLCMDELPPNTSPAEYARYQSGFTPRGIQVWCTRHDVNIMHVDFEGQKHPANLTAIKTLDDKYDELEGWT